MFMALRRAISHTMPVHLKKKRQKQILVVFLNIA